MSITLVEVILSYLIRDNDIAVVRDYILQLYNEIILEIEYSKDLHASHFISKDSSMMYLPRQTYNTYFMSLILHSCYHISSYKML